MNRYIISSCVLLALISGCIEQADTIAFSASHCDDTKDPYDQSLLGVKKTTWVDKTTLEITVNVPTNCTDDIRKGSFEIMDDTIILYYHYKKCFECSKCVCVRELLFTIPVEKKEYQFEVKSVEIK